MKGVVLLKEKVFLILLLCLSALVVFPTIVSAVTMPKPSVENANHVYAAIGLKPCGDPIDGPGWPGSCSVTG
jgi:hypothetical protein